MFACTYDNSNTFFFGIFNIVVGALHIELPDEGLHVGVLVVVG